MWRGIWGQWQRQQLLLKRLGACNYSGVASTIPKTNCTRNPNQNHNVSAHLLGEYERERESALCVCVCVLGHTYFIFMRPYALWAFSAA